MQNGTRELKLSILSQINQVVSSLLHLEHALEELTLSIINGVSAVDCPCKPEQAAAGKKEGAAPRTPAALSRLDQVELNEVSAALERNRWIKRQAADDLGLTFRQMNYRVKKFGLERMVRENRAREKAKA
jgi:transcriptional regulator with GAF, ATPase, and Fis domain